MFREGLLSLMTNIAYIRQSNLLEHFLETRLRQGCCSDHSTMSLNIGQNFSILLWRWRVADIHVYSLHRTSDYGNHTRRLYTAGQLQIVYHALAFFSHETNFVKFRCVENFICVTKPLLYMNLVTPLSCFYQKFISKFICQKAKDT